MNVFQAGSPPPPPRVLNRSYVSGGESPLSQPSNGGQSFIIVAFIVSIVVLASSFLYFLIRFLSRKRRSGSGGFPSAASSGTNGGAVHRGSRVGDSSDDRGLIESLPEFVYSSVTVAGGYGDAKDRECAICLSKFRADDRLRLLPICCHAFHVDCVDAWLQSNQTCPLCRSAVHASESDIIKILNSAATVPTPNSGGDSFRIEIGSVSRRRDPSEIPNGRRSYSMGSFDYVVDENSTAVTADAAVDRTHRTRTSLDKDEIGGEVPWVPEPPGLDLAAEVAAERSWLKEYVDRLASTASSSSRSLSFRSSGRFFTGSSGRSEVVAVGHGVANDLEANRIGAEISEMFRWLSGV